MADARSCIGGGSKGGYAWRFSLLFSHQPPAQESSGHTLGRHQRLRKPGEFTAIRRAGKGWSNELLFLRALANGPGPTRFGFSVSKRLGNAVVRNRVKRRLKEIVRQERVAGNWDIVLSARPPAAQASYRELRRAVEALLSRAGLSMPLESDIPPSAAKSATEEKK